MNYATISNNRKYYTSRKTKAAKTTSATPSVRRMDVAFQRCKRSSKRQNECRTYTYVADAFLKCSFLPKHKEAQQISKITDVSKFEEDFYRSLSLLDDHYRINPRPSRQFGYPYNIALALEDVTHKLRSTAKNFEEITLLLQGGKTFFRSEERCCTGSTLFYIPVLPLYRLSRDKKRRRAAQLLQSVCSYLYHIADIPYYRNENTYLYEMYEYISDWITSDDEHEDTAYYLSSIAQAQIIGDRMERKIYNQQNLNRFAERLKNFKVNDCFDNDCFELASRIFSLYEKYPNQSIFCNRYIDQDDPDDCPSCIRMEQYISFCANIDDGFFNMLLESINCEFQEYTRTEEPTIFKSFDKRYPTRKSLEFEDQLFTAIDNLIFLLNNY